MNFIILIFVFILSIITYLLITYNYYRCKNESTKYQLDFPILHKLFPNCFQVIIAYKPNIKNINYIISTITFSKDFDPIHYLYVKQESFITFTFVLDRFFSHFYIFSKKFVFKHIGIKFSQKYKLNNLQTYNMYGCINEKLMKFVQTHNPIYFYCSYFPANDDEMDAGMDKKYTGSVAELKLRLEDFKENIQTELLEIFDEIQLENEKRHKRLIKEFSEWKNKEIRKKNRTFWDKVMIKIKENQKFK